MSNNKANNTGYTFDSQTLSSSNVSKLHSTLERRQQMKANVAAKPVATTTKLSKASGK